MKLSNLSLSLSLNFRINSTQNQTQNPLKTKPKMKTASAPNLNRETTSIARITTNFFTFFQDPNHHDDTTLNKRPKIDHSEDTEASETSPYKDILSPIVSFNEMNKNHYPFGGSFYEWDQMDRTLPRSPDRSDSDASVGSNQFSDDGMDEHLAVLGYKVKASDMDEVVQKLEQLEMVMDQEEDGIYLLSSDTVHYNPSDLSGCVQSMLSELNAGSNDVAGQTEPSAVIVEDSLEVRSIPLYPEFIDVDAIFGMPNMLVDMAEGMLLSPPRIKVPPFDDSVEFLDCESVLWRFCY